MFSDNLWDLLCQKWGGTPERILQLASTKLFKGEFHGGCSHELDLPGQNPVRRHAAKPPPATHEDGMHRPAAACGGMRRLQVLAGESHPTPLAGLCITITPGLPQGYLSSFVVLGLSYLSLI